MNTSYDKAYKKCWKKDEALSELSAKINPRIRIFKSMLNYEKKKILDCGCGQHSILELLPENSVKYGIDISSEALKKGSGYKKVHGNILNMPFKDKEFDIIISNLVLEYIKDDVAALRSMNRCLKIGGSAVINVTINPKLWGEDDEFPMAVRRYAKGEFEAKTRKTGFKVVKKVYWGFPFYRLYRKIKLKRFDKKETIGTSAIKLVGGKKLYLLLVYLINFIDSLFSKFPWGIECIFLLKKVKDV